MAEEHYRVSEILVGGHMTEYKMIESTVVNAELLLTIFLFCFLNSSVIGCTDDWPMFQHDPQHTGFSSSHAPVHLREAWVYRERSKPEPLLAVSGDLVSIVSHDSISALSIVDGSLVMEKEYIICYSTPAVTEKKILIGSYDGLYCRDIYTGEEIWKYDIDFVTVYSSPIYVGDRIFVGSGPMMGWGSPESGEEASRNSKRVACIDLETGRVIWEYQARWSTEFSPAYFKGRLYVGGGRSVCCLDSQTGDLIWETNIEKSILSGLSLDGERVFVGDSNGIVCLNMEIGRILWHFDCKTAVNTTPAVAYNKVYFGTPDGILYCLDAESGSQVWKIDTKRVNPPSETAITGEVIVADKKVAFGTGDGVLYIADAESGRIRESVNLGDSSITSMAFTDGRLIVGLMDGTVICFEESSFRNAVFVLIVVAVILSSLALFWYCKKKSM